MGFQDMLADIRKNALPTTDNKKSTWQELLVKAAKEAASLKEPAQSFPEVQDVVEQEDQLSTEKPKKTAFDVNEDESSNQALDNWDTGKELETALKLDPKTGKLDIAPKQAAGSMSPRAYIQNVIDNNPYLAPVNKNTKFKQGTENWKRQNREGTEEFAKNKNTESATELINRALATRGEYSAPQKNLSIEEKIQDLLSDKQVYESPGVQERVPKEKRDKAIADIEDELASLYTADIGNNAAYVGNVAAGKMDWDEDTDKMVRDLVDEASKFYGYDKTDFMNTLMNAGLLSESDTNETGESSGKSTESSQAPVNTGVSDNQEKEFYDWLETTDSGKAFRDYWDKQGINLDKANKGYSRMRTINNADLWGNLVGYGDLSKYDVENFQGPEGWRNRLANSGIDVDADDAVDQLMNYMFVTNALRSSDLSADYADWSRYGSTASMPELIAYLYENDLLGLPSNMRQAYNESGLTGEDFASFYLASRLGQNGAEGYSVADLLNIINPALLNSGEAYELGFLDEDSPFQADENRTNKQIYMPSQLFAGNINPYSYADVGGIPYDLIDYDVIDTYLQLLDEAAQKEGKRVGLRNREG